jgi:hypothetical protein
MFTTTVILKFFRLILLHFILFCFSFSNFPAFAQHKVFNRAQVTYLFHNPYKESSFFNSLIDSLAKDRILLPLLSEDALQFAKKKSGFYPSQIYIPLFKYDDSLSFDIRNGAAYHMDFEYNPVGNPEVEFSFLDIYKQPEKYLLNYAVEILKYNFNVIDNKPFNFKRVNSRSFISAIDSEIELAKSVQIGDAIIKDNIRKVFSNVYIFGIMPISLKNKKSGLIEIEFSVMLFKINYNILLDSQSFWYNCFTESNFKFCLDNKESIGIEMKDIQTIKISADSSIQNKSWNSYTFAQSVLIDLTSKIKNYFIK